MPRFSHRVFYGALRHVASTSGRIRSSNRTLTSLSYFHKPGKNPFLPWTMGEVVDRTADAKGDNTAIVSCHQGIAKTFTELRDEAAEAFATHFDGCNPPITYSHVFALGGIVSSGIANMAKDTKELFQLLRILLREGCPVRTNFAISDLSIGGPAETTEDNTIDGTKCMLQKVNQFAASLVSLKLPLGSKIGMLATNIYEWMVVMFAVAKAGLVLVNINTAYQAPELELCLNHTKCAALIVAGKFCRQSYYEMLLQIAPELDRASPGELKSTRLPLLKHVIMINDSPMRGTVTFDELMKSATAKDYAAMNAIYSKLQFDEAVNIQFTSGTTGRPKAAMLSHFNVVNNANLIGRGFGLHEQSELICLNAPMTHCYGIVVGTLTAAMFGSTTVMPAPSFKAEAALEAITKHRCTFIYGTPTMFIDMLAQLERGHYDLSSVRKGIMAGSPCPSELVKNARKRLNMQRFHVMYGATETSPAISGIDPDEPMNQWIETVGVPLDHTEVKIVNARGDIVPVNEVGELCTRGYHVFMGYLGEEGKEREAIRNNWYHTGDEATMSEDGRITIRGRIKDMIIRGGENIYPREIEDYLYTHPDVLEVQVVGVPDTRLGEEVCAWIKLKPGTKLSQEDVRTFCKGKISYFKIPKYILFVDSFPKTESGKILKNKMRIESEKILNL